MKNIWNRLFTYSKQIDGSNLMRMLDSQEGLFPRKLHLLVQVVPNCQNGYPLSGWVYIFRSYMHWYLIETSSYYSNSFSLFSFFLLFSPHVIIWPVNLLECNFLSFFLFNLFTLYVNDSYTKGRWWDLNFEFSVRNTMCQLSY